MYGIPTNGNSGLPLARAVREQIRRLMEASNWLGALESIERALHVLPQETRLFISRAQCLLALGRLPEACEAAFLARRSAPADPVILDAIGSLFSQGNDQRQALEAFDRAVALAPNNPHFLFNRATIYRFLGRLTEAGRDYDRVIELRHDDYEAYKNRSELRTQSPAENHVAELEQILAQGISEWRGQVQIRYALAKEYEDLGEHTKSFAHLEVGAMQRRRHMRYEVATDEATVDWIMEAFPGTGSGSVHGAPSAAPIFIVGLPRSGTTLVDRILGNHSEVHSAGELDHFALCIVAGVRRDNQAPMSRQELVARSAHLDFATLGAEYLERVRHTVGAKGRFTDKMPLNYLYCGLIHRAFPQAKIVHLTRHPMAVCYAMYKTLFKDAYPFSYDLEELGRYYIAYRRLMDHWHASLPGVIHSLSYEALVGDQIGETRKLLDYCGLDWQDTCMDFHRNAAPTTTASAVQVRQPLYATSIAQWRCYAAQLEPLGRQLRAAGLDVE
jgi:tetratricopeptide (TPR) repeat protein